jgi:hypothetical protein
MVEDLRRHLGLQADQVRVVEWKTTGATTSFASTGLTGFRPPGDAALIDWVIAAEPRIKPAAPDDYEVDPSLWQDDWTN